MLKFKDKTGKVVLEMDSDTEEITAVHNKKLKEQLGFSLEEDKKEKEEKKEDE